MSDSPPTVATRAGAAPAASRDGRGAWVLVIGQGVSTWGDAVLLVAVPLTVLDLTGSVYQVSIAFILTQVPALFGFLAGSLRRRFEPRRLLITYDLSRALLLTAIGLLLSSGARFLVVVYALLLLTSAASALFRPTRIDFIADVVTGPRLARFNSLDRTIEALAVSGGAAAAGFAYHFLPRPACYLLDAATFLGSALALFAVRAPRSDASRPDRQPGSLAAALVAIHRSPTLRFLVGGEALTGLAFGVYSALFVVYVRDQLHAGAITFGNLEMVSMAGAALTGLALAATKRTGARSGTGAQERTAMERAAVVGYLGMGLTMVALGFVSAVTVAVGCVAGCGMANMLYAVNVRTLLQSTSAPSQRVHVFAVESVLSRLAQIAGAGAGGVLLGRSLVRINWAICGVGIVVLGVAGWGAWTLLRRPGSPEETVVVG